MYTALQSAHSGMRWIVLITLLLALATSVSLWIKKESHTQGSKKLLLYAMISAHIQLLIGIVLYFKSPKVLLSDMGTAMKDAMIRFFTVEHFTMMLIAILLITFAYSKAKRSIGNPKGTRIIAILLILAFVFLMAGIPWPPRFGAGWF